MNPTHRTTLEGLRRALATMDKALETTRIAIQTSEKTIRSLTRKEGQ